MCCLLFSRFSIDEHALSNKIRFVTRSPPQDPVQWHWQCLAIIQNCFCKYQPQECFVSMLRTLEQIGMLAFGCQMERKGIHWTSGQDTVSACVCAHGTHCALADSPKTEEAEGQRKTNRSNGRLRPSRDGNKLERRGIWEHLLAASKCTPLLSHPSADRRRGVN